MNLSRCWTLDAEMAPGSNLQLRYGRYGILVVLDHPELTNDIKGARFHGVDLVDIQPHIQGVAVEWRHANV